MVAASININITGADAAADILMEAAEQIRENLTRGLAEAGEIVVSEAKAICPVSTDATRPGGPHGELRASINKSVSGNSCTVGTNTEYAPYVEFGTCKMAAQPFLVPSLLNNVDEVTEAIKRAIGL